MAWSIRCTFDPIRSYAQAAKAWKKGCDLFPGCPAGPRGLVDRRKKHLAIERTEAEDFILRLYNFNCRDLAQGSLDHHSCAAFHPVDEHVRQPLLAGRHARVGVE